MVEAKYTILYSNWLVANPELSPLTNYGELLLSYMSESLFSSDMASDMIDMLASVYRYYECGTEDKDEMLQFMKDTFDEYKDYYYELITNYKKAYDYALNNKRVITKSDKLNIEGNTQISNEQDASNTRYDLPNKVVPSSNWRSTPSDITDTKDSSLNNKDYTNETTRDSTTTTEFNNEFIDLKNKYINQIRNLYREFAMKFKDCFYQVY